MLEDMATTVGHESIVSWQPHGEAFRVHLPEVFASTVMPRYFTKQTKYKSFVRQLHMYGFHRICEGRDKGAYFHSMFIRNKKSMSLQMTRQKLKGKDSSCNPTNRYAAGDHPDFYSLVRTINVDTRQYQDRRSLTNGIQSDPRMLHAYATTEKKKKEFYLLHDPAAVCTDTCSIDHHTDGSIGHHRDDDDDEEEENASLLMTTRTSLFNQEAAGVAVPSPALYQRNSGSETIIDLAVEWLGLRGGNESNRHSTGHDGLFFGKRFFHVAETMNTVDGRFQLADNIRGGRI
jgi:hypothetical protein